jgi:hypothetical protein
VKEVVQTPFIRINNMRTLSIWKLRSSLFAVTLVATSWTPASHAQDLEMSLEVNVPFAFENGTQHFAAGLYTIRMEEPHILVIRSRSQSGLTMTWFDQDLTPSKTTKVVFQRYGDRYFLSEIWLTGDVTHTYIPPSKTEKELQEVANRTANTGVQVALLATSH